VVWWIVAAAACSAALLLGAAGQGTWAAAVACLALVLAALLQVRLAASRQELRRLFEDTESVLDSLSGGLLTVDLHGRIGAFNPAAERILGVRAAEVRGRTLAAAFAERAPLLHAKLERSLRERTPIHRFELQLAPSAGGEGRPIGLSTSVLRTASGENRGLLATFQDLSDVRRMQERVRRADRLAAVGELSASIAHEIRNPLAAIANSVDMLRDELPVRGEQRRLMDLVVKESERLNRILDDFLEYARVRPLRAVVVPVSRAVDEVVTLLRCHPDIGDHLDIRVDDRTGGRGVACIDEAQMKQVYVNLALNAFEAMGHRGTLRVTIESASGDEVGLADTPCMRLGFRDTGPGIEPGQEATIFEPFHTTKPHGTGLGLSIAARVVESHGGRIEAVSLAEGGAEFSIYLPEAIECPPAGAGEADGEQGNRPASGGGDASEAAELGPRGCAARD
jgi:two-component system sensor histidine kinase PilS (NtrC family)